MQPLKFLYNRPFFDRLIQDFKKYYPHFDDRLFLDLIFDENWDNLELKPRMRHITHSLHQTLGLSYQDTVKLFEKVISEREGEALEKMFFPDYIEVYGLDEVETSLNALEAFTSFASSEFAIRPFIVQAEESVMQRMREWAEHDNHHIRRLASEGCRPRLPWAMALPRFKKNPSPVLAILEQLKSDETEYVRRSVANNLNDITKDHPDLVLDIATRWLQEEDTNPPHRKRLVKHALRTLLKQGNTAALVLFGFGHPAAIEVENLETTTPKVVIGEDFYFSFNIHNTAHEPVLLRIEYAIDFVKKTGKTSKKVFKITENTYPSGCTNISKKQAFKDLTTRKHYAGTHRLSMIINGVEKASLDFEVTE